MKTQDFDIVLGITFHNDGNSLNDFFIYYTNNTDSYLKYSS